MARSGERVAPERELQWFVEDRREHVTGVIGPALAEGRVVLTDRYFLSSVAYQGARGLVADEILRQSEAELPLPDLALVFELPVPLALERARARGAIDPEFERLDFLERVSSIFARLERPYIARIQASGSPPRVQARVRAAYDAL